jgi:hypothetical protein
VGTELIINGRHGASAEDRAGTRIGVPADLPAAEGHRLAAQQDMITASLARLAELAAV